MKAVAALALGAAAASAQSCGEAAQDLKLTVSNFTFDGVATYSTPSHLATKEGVVDFELTLSALKDEVVKCSATSVTYPAYYDGSEFYDCESTENIDASFKYNLETGKLNIKADFDCPDSYYKAKGKTMVMPEKKCDTNTLKNEDWSLENPGKYYSQISTFCFNSKDRKFEPTSITGVA